MSVTKYNVQPGSLSRLSWRGDNRVFVVEELLPAMKLRPYVRQVIRWAYGYDGSPRSFEMESDGSTCVPDRFMLGMIKEPPGVGHDFLNRVFEHRTPDGHEWNITESCRWYRLAMEDFGYPRFIAMFRQTGLWLSGPAWWR